MTEQPNPADFSKNEKPGEFTVRFRVRGEVWTTVEADDLEDAEEKAYAMLEDETFGLELDDIIQIDVDSVRKSPAMYRVTRDGANMQVSRLEAGDLPREPNEGGF